MSGRGPVHIISSSPTLGMILEKNGYRYSVTEILPRRGNQFRLRTRSIDPLRLEMWFTVMVEEQ